jgi:hypothetical protein
MDNFADPFRKDLRSGVSVDVVRDYVTRHLTALRQQTPSAERDQAIRDCEAFQKEIAALP